MIDMVDRFRWADEELGEAFGEGYAIHSAPGELICQLAHTLICRLASAMQELGDPLAIDRETCAHLLNDVGPEAIRLKAATFVADAKLLGVL